MPAQTQKAPGFSLAGSMKAHANEEPQVKQDFSDLPPDVHGVAQLVDAKIGVYKQSPDNDRKGLTGNRFLYLAGMVVSPVEVDETLKRWEPSANGRPAGVQLVGIRKVKVQGRRTNLTLPLCESRKTDFRTKREIIISAGDNANAALNEVKLLGGRECCTPLAALPPAATDEQALTVLGNILNALKKSKIRFKFRTSGMDPTERYPTKGMTFHHWEGAEGVQAAPADPAAEAVAAVEESPAADASPPDADADGAVAELLAKSKEAAAPKSPQEAAIVAAQNQLLDLAEGRGWDRESVAALDTWDEVAQCALTEPQAEGDAGQPAEEAPAEEAEPEAWPGPAEGEVYGYRPMVKGPGGKLVKGRKQIDVTVNRVFAKGQTCEVVSNVDQKTLYKAVPWDQLIIEE